MARIGKPLGRPGDSGQCPKGVSAMIIYGMIAGLGQLEELKKAPSVPRPAARARAQRSKYRASRPSVWKNGVYLTWAT